MQWICKNISRRPDHVRTRISNQRGTAGRTSPERAKQSTPQSERKPQPRRNPRPAKSARAKGPADWHGWNTRTGRNPRPAEPNPGPGQISRSTPGPGQSPSWRRKKQQALAPGETQVAAVAERVASAASFYESTSEGTPMRGFLRTPPPQDPTAPRPEQAPPKTPQPEEPTPMPPQPEIPPSGPEEPRLPPPDPEPLPTPVPGPTDPGQPRPIAAGAHSPRQSFQTRNLSLPCG
jgi:hypothetical protein